jgi:hypothetical protein
MTAEPKSMNEVIGGERYRTGLSYLLADDGNEVFLFRALNSNYFVQRHGDKDTMEILSADQAEDLYHQLSTKHYTLAAAFPRAHGGIGMDTISIYDDEDDDENE